MQLFDLPPLWRTLGVLRTQSREGRSAGQAFVSARGKAIYFDHCRRCGCVVLYRAIKSDRLSVSLRLIEDPEALRGMRIRRFDGAKSWKDVATCALAEPWW